VAAQSDGLRARVVAVDQALAARRRERPIGQGAAALLRRVAGVGPVRAATLLAALPELGTRKRQHMAAVVGVAPVTRPSGRWRGRALIAGGRRAVRATLARGARVAARHHPAIGACYSRLVAAGKPKKVALTAGLRTLLVILNAIRRQHRPWPED